MVVTVKQDDAQTARLLPWIGAIRDTRCGRTGDRAGHPRPFEGCVNVRMQVSAKGKIAEKHFANKDIHSRIKWTVRSEARSKTYYFDYIY